MTDSDRAYICVGGELKERDLDEFIVGLMVNNSSIVNHGGRSRHYPDKAEWLELLAPFVGAPSGSGIRFVCKGLVGGVAGSFVNNFVGIYPFIGICRGLGLHFNMAVYTSGASLKPITAWWAPGLAGLKETTLGLKTDDNDPAVSGLKLRDIMARHTNKLLFDYELIVELNNLLADYDIPPELPGFYISPTEPKASAFKQRDKVLRCDAL